MKRAIDLIPVPCALGAPDAGVADGPAVLRQAGLSTALHRCGRVASWCNPVVADATLSRVNALSELCVRLADVVAASLGAGRMPLVVGGDHTIAAGTWCGVARALAKPVGLLWIDAHLDAHIAHDSPSGNPHGMPLAFLLGDGDTRLSTGVLSPRKICVVGARDWEPSEMERLRRFGVRVIDNAEITRRGIADTLREALEIVGTGTAGFGITIDVDVFDPTEAPGVICPAPGGLPGADWLAGLRGLATCADCLALEIVEFDPSRDVAERTARLVLRLAGELFAPTAEELLALETAHGAGMKP